MESAGIDIYRNYFTQLKEKPLDSLEYWNLRAFLFLSGIFASPHNGHNLLFIAICSEIDYKYKVVSSERTQ